jgi:hypothetical protein
MSLVEGLDITLPEVTHGARQRLGRGRRSKQMDVVAHENVGVHCDGIFGHGVVQQSVKVLTILVVNEDGTAIHATLGDMQRAAWEL